MNLEQLTEWFRLMTIINAVILIFSSFAIMGMKDLIARWHSRMFGLAPEQVSAVGYAYLGFFKALFIIFNFGPYLALYFLSMS